MLELLEAKGPGDQLPASPRHDIPEGQPMLVEYASKDIIIPPDFLSLTSPPSDAKPVTFTPIDWKATCLPENDGRYAVMLGNVVSPSECQALLRLVESTVDLSRANKLWNTPGDENPWRPAMVYAGAGYEVLDTTYRNSDRIVWDCQEVVDRLWARCLQGEVGEILRAKLNVLDGNEEIIGPSRKNKDRKAVHQRWEMKGLNKRMRFLRYGPGQFFRPHCDGHYSEVVDEKIFKTFFTLHLYLNDSVAEAGEEAELVGGATSFISNHGSRKAVVDPKAGRVLIFQHRGLYHAGDDVVEGTKYTMRAEVMYELMKQEEEARDDAEKSQG